MPTGRERGASRPKFSTLVAFTLGLNDKGDSFWKGWSLLFFHKT